MNQLRWLIPIMIVGCANIALNIFSRAAAQEHRSFIEAMASRFFIFAFLAGCVSLTGLLWVYQSNMELARAVLLMGTVSIIGGSLFGILFVGNRLHWTEVLLLAGIAVLFVARWLLTR